MRQDPHSRSFSTANRIKHLFLDSEDSPTAGMKYLPFFYVEVRIDFNDVRTGFRSTVSLNKAVEIHPMTPDLLWAQDLIRDVDPGKTKTQASETVEIGRLPDFVDAGFVSQMETQFIHYLLRSYKTRVYRNFALDTYSNAGESFSDFHARCLDLLNGPKRQELDTLYEVFARRLEQIRQKYLHTNASDNLDLAKAESQDRNLFLKYSDCIADLFFQPEKSLNVSSVKYSLPEINRDMEEYLASLNLEARQAIEKIQDAYEQKAQSVDEYILHPNLKDIHFVRCCILWIQTKAA
jgi:hypothetical protein